MVDTIRTGLTGWKQGTYVPPNALYPPLNFLAQAQGSTIIRLSWDAPADKADATGYRVYELVSGSRVFVGFADWGINQLDHIGLTPNSYHEYVAVTTDGSALNSEDSNGANASTLPATTTGDGILFDNPKTATGYRFDDPQDKPDVVGDGIVFDNPKTNSGYRFADPTLPTPDPIPVAAPTITNFYATGSTTAQVQWVDNQVNQSQSFLLYCRVVSTGDLVSGYPKQISGTLSSYQISLLSPSTWYEVSMTATVGSDTSGLSNVEQALTTAGNVGAFVPNIANINFEGMPLNGQIIQSLDPVDGVQQSFTGAGTTSNWDNPQNIANGRQWYRQEYVDAGEPPQNYTNVVTDSRSGNQGGCIYVVRPTEPRAPYENGMGVDLSLKTIGKSLGANDEYWQRFDLYLPPDFDPHTGVSGLKFLQQRLNKQDGSNAGAFFFNISAQSGAYPGGWRWDCGEINNLSPISYSGITNLNVLPTGHPGLEQTWENNVEVDPSLGWERGVWMALEFYQKLDPDPTKTITRMWRDGKLVHEHQGFILLATTTSELESCKIFSYWNGAESSANIPKFGPALFEEPSRILIDNYMFTDQDAPPSNTDDDGNFYIGDIHTTAPPEVDPGPTPPSTLEFNSEGGTVGQIATTHISGSNHYAGAEAKFSTEDVFAGNQSIRCGFIQNQSGGESSCNYRFSTPLVEGDEVWWRGYIKVPDDWVWQSGSGGIKGYRFKVFDNSGQSRYINIYPKNDRYLFENWVDGYSNSAFYVNNDGSANDQANISSFPSPKGQGWEYIEQYIRFDVASSAGGSPVWRIWRNGVMVFEDFKTATIFPGGYCDVVSTFGHVEGGSPVNQKIYIDEVKFVINQDPGKRDNDGNSYIGNINTMNTLIYDDFEAEEVGYPSSKTGEYGFYWNQHSPGANRPVVSDLASNGGTKSLRFEFNTTNAISEQRFFFGRAYKEIEYEFDILFPLNYAPNTDGRGKNKGPVQYWYGSTYGCINGEAWMGSEHWPQYNMKTSYYPGMGAGNCEGHKWGTPDFLFPDMNNDLGVWRTVKYHIRVSDIGQSNGFVRFYKDGVLVQANENLPYAAGSNEVNGWDRGYLMGAGDSGFAEFTVIYIDNITFRGMEV